MHPPPAAGAKRRPPLPGANFGDTYSLAVNGLKLNALGASQLVFGWAPGWVKCLLALRNLIVKPFGLNARTGTGAPRQSTYRLLSGHQPVD
ncbi:DUF2867 domain-containing protein [Mesorhizobium sp. BHbsci]